MKVLHIEEDDCPASEDKVLVLENDMLVSDEYESGNESEEVDDEVDNEGVIDEAIEGTLTTEGTSQISDDLLQFLPLEKAKKSHLELFWVSCLLG